MKLGLTFLLSISSATLGVSSGQAQVQSEVGGVAIPRTRLAIMAENYIRSNEPDFLFNHSVRLFLFGAYRLKAQNVSFNPETAYVAALFHDLGLVREKASPSLSFEIDSANAAEEFVIANGGSPEEARIVWNAVVMHDMGRAYQRHQTSAAMLLGAGAASDVDGVDPSEIPPAIVQEILSAYPRLDFKRRFTAAAIDHCQRKPTSQIGWLDCLCRKVVPNAARDDVVKEIESSPFSE